MSIEQTLSIIKPDATKRNLTGKINSKLEDSGLKIIAQKEFFYQKPKLKISIKFIKRGHFIMI